MYSHTNPNLDVATVDPGTLALEGGLRRNNAPQHEIDALYQDPIKVTQIKYKHTSNSFLDRSCCWHFQRKGPHGPFIPSSIPPGYCQSTLQAGLSTAPSPH